MSFNNFVGWTGIAAAYSATGLVIYITSLIIYRVFFHPLASYPGPFFAKITDLYTLYHCWAGYRHVDFLNQHAKYGPVFRYGPNKLSFNTHTALHTIHGPKANVRKADFYHGFDSPSGPNLLGSIQKDVHSRKRRVLAFAFSDKALKSMEQYMLANTRIFCDKLASTTEPLNMAKWCMYLAGDILGDLCFGNSFNTLTSLENRFSLEVISASGKFLQMSGAAYNLKDSIIPKLLFYDLADNMRRHRAGSLARATERTKMANSDRKDFYHYLMEAKNSDSDEKYTLEETWVESNTLIAAGSDTTSLVLSATFFYLSQNQDVLAKVQKEVRAAFKGKEVEDIKSGPELNGCRYLKACLDESMRMTPPTPGMLPRIVLPGGITVDNHFIPAGVEVGTPFYSLFHNPTYFPDSFKYRPERWFLSEASSQSEEEKEKLDLANQAFAPFSLGPRTCIGKNMAYMEMTIVMARVLFLFDFRAAKEQVLEGKGRAGEYAIKDHFICGKDGPMIEFRPAKRTSRDVLGVWA